MDLDKLADLVVLTVKNAIAPVLERVAAAEARLSVLGDLRDRVVTVETKAAWAPTTEPVVAFDAAPLLARVAALEAHLAIVGELRDRVVTVETKAAIVPEPVPVPLVNGLSDADIELMLRNHLDPLTKDLAGVRERLAVVEVRAPMPGPAGPAGTDGKDGLNGKDGADGFGFDDFEELYDGERTYTHRFIKGDRVKEFVFTTSQDLYRGVYVEGKTYERGDGVTWGGSEWHCNETTTTKPGDGSKAWTLKVKRGRDGKDGKDGLDRVPVVKVGAA